MNLNHRIEVLLSLGVPQDRIPLLEKYLQLLWEKNVELNLFSRKMTFHELVDNHLIDCLLPLKQFPTTAKKVADFGSGGGMPGVLYALLFPKTEFCLFEKSPKKQAFLKSCRALAPSLEIVGEIPESLEGFDLIVARAFKPLPVIFELSRSYAQNGGRYFLLKGRAEKIQEEWASTPVHLRPANFEVIPLVSPVLEVERHLVVAGDSLSAL